MKRRVRQTPVSSRQLDFFDVNFDIPSDFELICKRGRLSYVRSRS